MSSNIFHTILIIFQLLLLLGSLKLCRICKICRSDNKYYFELDRFVHSLTGNQEENIVRFDNQSSLIWRVCL